MIKRHLFTLIIFVGVLSGVQPSWVKTGGGPINHNPRQCISDYELSLVRQNKIEVDRGSMRDTVIGPGCWIDNLVQIGHNVEVGRGCIIAAMAGISGSTKVGNFVAIGGQVGLAGHLKIGDGAQIAAQSGIMTDVQPGVTLCGTPAVPIKEFFRQVATLRKLSQSRGKNGGRN